MLDEKVILDRLNQIFENVLDLDSVNLTRGTGRPMCQGGIRSLTFS